MAMTSDSADRVVAADAPAVADPLQVSPQTVLASAATENFPVALRLLPRRERQALQAIYAYARFVDDLGDEASGDRAGLLDQVEADLAAVWGGRPQLPVLTRLAPVVAAHVLPADPFRRLLEANRLDQRVSRYPRYEDLLDYCRLSATPVGELVLGVFGVATPARVRDSDAVCTALQVLEHCQDVVEDYAAGRVYVPLADLAAQGCTVGELSAAPSTPATRRVLATLVARAETDLDAGSRLVAGLGGPARLAVAGFVAGGRATAAALRAADYDVASRPVRPAPARTLWEAVRLLRRSRRPRSGDES